MAKLHFKLKKKGKKSLKVVLFSYFGSIFQKYWTKDNEI